MVYNEHNFVFINEDNERHIGLNYISKLFKKCILECDFIEDKSIHFHNLRNTCCTIMCSLGYDKEKVKDWLGHKEGSEITDKVYNYYKHILHKNRLEKLHNIIVE